MGVVYLGFDEAGEAVAVKTLPGAVDPEARTRMRREAELMAAGRQPPGRPLRGRRHRGCRQRGRRHRGGRAVARATYVPGPSLAEATVPLPEASLHRLAVGLAEALLALEQAGIVHRDLKPGNVILGFDGPVLVDFGIARAGEEHGLTQVGTTIGSPQWMPPEQLQGRPISGATDVWGWAAVLAYAATGRPPFGSGPVEALAARIQTAEPDLDGAPAWLVPALTAGLRRDPATRPAVAELTGLVGVAVHGVPGAEPEGAETVGAETVGTPAAPAGAVPAASGPPAAAAEAGSDTAPGAVQDATVGLPVVPPGPPLPYRPPATTGRPRPRRRRCAGGRRSWWRPWSPRCWRWGARCSPCGIAGPRQGAPSRPTGVPPSPTRPSPALPSSSSTPEPSRTVATPARTPSKAPTPRAATTAPTIATTRPAPPRPTATLTPRPPRKARRPPGWDGSKDLAAVVGPARAVPPFPSRMRGFTLRETRTRQVRVFEGSPSAEVFRFPATMNGCASGRILVRWRVVNPHVTVQSAAAPFPLLPGAAGSLAWRHPGTRDPCPGAGAPSRRGAGRRPPTRPPSPMSWWRSRSGTRRSEPAPTGSCAPEGRARWPRGELRSGSDQGRVRGCPRCAPRGLLASSEVFGNPAFHRRNPVNDFHDRLRRQGLVRPASGRVLAGVCAGLGRRFGIDPWPARLLFVLALMVVPGSQILVYPLLWVLIPGEQTESYVVREAR